EPAGEVRTVAWESNRYPDYSAAQVWGPECWNRAVVGEALPDACLTASALASETDPFRASPWTAGTAALLAIGVLGLVGWRTVGVHPIVARSNTGDSSPSHFDEVAAVSLMQHTESERSARIAAEPRRRDPSHPFIRGGVLALLVLVPLVLLFGYGRTLGWALNTGLILGVLAVPPLALMQLTLVRPTDLDSAIARASFLCGAVATLLFGSFLALMFRVPLRGLNGVEWPFPF